MAQLLFYLPGYFCFIEYTIIYRICQVKSEGDVNMLYLEDLIEENGNINLSKVNLTPEQKRDLKKLWRSKKTVKRDYGKFVRIVRKEKGE